MIKGIIIYTGIMFLLHFINQLMIKCSCLFLAEDRHDYEICVENWTFELEDVIHDYDGGTYCAMILISPLLFPIILVMTIILGCGTFLTFLYKKYDSYFKISGRWDKFKSDFLDYYFNERENK